MVKRDHPVVDLTAGEDVGEPVLKRQRSEEEPDHLICPITREMFRDPVFLVASGHTYERAAIEEHLRRNDTDPRSNVVCVRRDVCTNFSMRGTVESWLEDNPERTPDGWKTRALLPPTLPPRANPMDAPPTIYRYRSDLADAGPHECDLRDLEVLCIWRASCPELERLWPADNANGFSGITWNAIGRVVSLDLRDNRLSGEIPKDLGRLWHLENLDLGNNQLSGEIPKELGRLLNLQELRLNSNQLRGEIPKELGELSDLTYLNLRINQLTGEIPKELGRLWNLEHLDLDINQLSGEIPKELGELTDLKSLFIDNNQLSGEIPKELGRLYYLQEFCLSNNRLSGEIPKELGRLPHLLALLLNNNRLSGEIPKELGQLSHLQALLLNINELGGGIPKELGRLTDLQMLDLSDNQLTGEIPAELGRLPHLPSALSARPHAGGRASALLRR